MTPHPCSPQCPKAAHARIRRLTNALARAILACEDVAEMSTPKGETPAEWYGVVEDINAARWVCRVALSTIESNLFGCCSATIDVYPHLRVEEENGVLS